MATADVVVIGGGVNGLSTAFNLARLGVENVVVLERGELASGASGKSGALVRMHYTNPYESKLAYESLKIFQNWNDEVGGDCGWHQPGFVQVVAPGYEEQLEANVRDQQAIGIDTTVVTPDELKKLFPEMRVDDIGAAAYEESSGWADPNATAYAFAEAARRLGVDIHTHCEVTSIGVNNGRISAVNTTEGRFDTETVIVAAGVGASKLLGPLGLDFGLVPYRTKVALFRWPPAFKGPQPVVIDAIGDAWMRPEDGNLTLIGAESGSHQGAVDGFDQTIDNDYVEVARGVLANRFPAFATATMRGGWAGLYTMSPDHRPIIDQISSIDGLFCMVGDSGSSFKTSPAIGRCLAEWVVHGEPQTADLSPFSADRFDGENPWLDEENYGRRNRTISR
ncbi:MAG: NAD(P)/FAD-dependent oxidoreductase [Chloroflexota bacterium]